jgi:uncharacterized protein
MRINKYVLDANIWISYFINGKEDLLTEIVIENKITFYYCNELLTEIRRVLDYPHLRKYKIKPAYAVNFVKQISVLFTLATPIKDYISKDQNDNYIIALALQTNAGFITSGDKHILSEKAILEKKFPKLKIISKAEFEKEFF